MIHEIFTSVYWKAIVVIVLSLLATFAHEIDAMKDGVVCYMLLAVLAMLVWSGEEFGYVILVAALFVLSYNNVVYRKNAPEKVG